MTKLIDLAKAKLNLPPPEARRAIRESLGLPQGAIGEQLGVSGATIGRWENGTREPRGELLLRYSTLLRDLAKLDRTGGIK